MVAKEYKKYDLIIKIGNTLPEDTSLPAMFGELATIDFGAAVEMWEYMLNLHVAELQRVVISHNLESRVYDVLMSKSEVRLKQALTESAPLARLIYTSSATSAIGGNLAFLASLVLTNKIEQASELLKLVVANKNTNIDFGDRMKLILDAVFDTYCAKNNTKVPSLNRKQTMMLLEFALKIKGPNKALLVQRIKELG